MKLLKAKDERGLQRRGTVWFHGHRGLGRLPLKHQTTVLPLLGAVKVTKATALSFVVPSSPGSPAATTVPYTWTRPGEHPRHTVPKTHFTVP